MHGIREVAESIAKVYLASTALLFVRRLIFQSTYGTRADSTVGIISHLSCLHSLRCDWIEANSRPTDNLRHISRMKCSAALVQFLQAAATDDCVIISTTLENETAEVGSSAAYAGDHSETDAWTALVEEANRAQQSQLHPAGTRSGIDIPKLQPQLWLLRNTATGGKWCFVCYVPEGVHPRGKMHAATARDAIRNAVGLEHFVAGEFHATELSELTLGAFHDWRHTDKRSSMSQREREQADVEESVKAAQAAMPSRVATMQAVPIRTDAVLEGLLQAMKSTALPFAAASSSAGSGTSPSGAAASAAGEGGMSAGALGSPGGAAGAAAGGVSATAVNWIQIQVIPTSPGGSETIVSGGHGHQSEHAALMPHLTTTSSAADGDERASEPRFYLVRPTPPGNGSVLMIYHCPELSKPKQRMLYSTAKAAVMEAAVKAGLPVARTVRPVCMWCIELFCSTDPLFLSLCFRAGRDSRC